MSRSSRTRSVDSLGIDEASRQELVERCRHQTDALLRYVRAEPETGFALVERALTTAEGFTNHALYGLTLERLAEINPEQTLQLAARVLHEGNVRSAQLTWSENDRRLVRDSAERVFRALALECGGRAPELYYLTTDLMEQQFGPVRAELLANEPNRKILVRSEDTGQVLEQAIVSFEEAGIAAYPEVHRRICEGALMGQAFREAGVLFVRDEQIPIQAPLSERLRELFGTEDGDGVFMDVAILVGPDRISYARNREIYSPAIKWPE